jgi:hypothetical protein
MGSGRYDIFIARWRVHEEDSTTEKAKQGKRHGNRTLDR